VFINVGQTMRSAAEDFLFRISGTFDSMLPECGGYAAEYSAGTYSGRGFASLHCHVPILSEVTVTVRQVFSSSLLLSSLEFSDTKVYEP